MGTCTAFSQRHLHPRGSQLQRLCCGGAPARSPVTTYQEAGAGNAQGKEASRQLPHEPLAQHVSPRTQRRREPVAPAILDSSPAGLLLREHDTPPAASCSRTSANGTHVRTATTELVAAGSPPSLHTPCLASTAEERSVQPHFLLPPSGPSGLKQQPLVLQHPHNVQQDVLQQQQQPQRQQRQALSRDNEATGVHLGQLGAVQAAVPAGQAAAGAADVSLEASSSRRSAAAAAAAAVPRSSSELPYHGSSTLAYTPHPPLKERVSTAGQATGDGQYQRQCSTGGAGLGAEDGGLPPYLDAASRSAGVASTSDQQLQQLSSTGGSGRGGEESASGRRGGRLSGRRRRVPRGQEERGSAAPEPSDGTSVRPAPRSVKAPGSRVAAAARTLAQAAAAVAVAGMASEAVVGTDSNSSGSRSSESNTRVGGGVPEAAAAATGQPPAECRAAAAAAAKLRRPRAPSAAEHQTLRLRAQLLQAALLPRDPTEDDLRLTARVMCATHWRDLVSLLAEHRERHNKRDLAERLTPFLQRSAKLQQPRRRGGGGGAPAAAAAAAAGTAAAAAADQEGGGGGAASGLGLPALPVSALPLTPQHVAAALLRTWQLLSSVSGPPTPAEGRMLHSMVDWLARLAVRLAPSPGTTLRELTTIFYALVRLRHPLGKRYYLDLMNEARKRFSVALPQRSTGRGRGGAAAAATTTAAAATSLPYNAQDMSQLIWAVANCGMLGLRDDWAASYFSALLPVVSELTPQGVGMVLHSQARLHCAPPPAVLAALCSRLVRLMGCEDHGDPRPPQPPSPPLVTEAAAVLPPDNGLTPGPADVLASSARARPGKRQRKRPPPNPQQGAPPPPPPPAQQPTVAVVETHGSETSSQSLPDAAAPASMPVLCQPADVSMSLWALATLRLPPSGYCPHLLPAVERYSRNRLIEFPEQELSNLVWAMARLQHVPGRDWVRHLYDAITPVLPELRPQALSTLLYGIAQMSQRPDPEWLDAVLPYIQARLRWFPPQSLALTIHALAVMGCRPPDAWLAAFHVQLESYRGQLDIRVRNKVREAYRTMGFRPGWSPLPPAAAATAAATAATAAPPDLWQQQQQQHEEEEQSQQEPRQQKAGRSGRGGPRWQEGPLRAERDVVADAPSRWYSSSRSGASDSQVDSRQRQQQRQAQGLGQEQEKGGEQGREEEGAATRRRRAGAAGEAGQRGEESGAGPAVNDGVEQVLVRPSRFVF